MVVCKWIFVCERDWSIVPFALFFNCKLSIEIFFCCGVQTNKFVVNKIHVITDTLQTSEQSREEGSGAKQNTSVLFTFHFDFFFSLSLLLTHMHPVSVVYFSCVLILYLWSSGALGVIKSNYVNFRLVDMAKKWKI